MTAEPIPRPGARHRLAVILPAFNEAERIGATLGSIAAYRTSLGVDWPIIVADDGSTDRTIEIARTTASALGLPLEILAFAHRGKALTVRDAMLRAAAEHEVDYCMMLDADDELRIDQLDHIIWDGDRAIYIGRRVGETNGVVGTRPPLFRRVMSAGMRTANLVLLGLRFPDTQCGFKLFPREYVAGLFSQQRSARWVFDAEILVIGHRVSGMEVREIPVTWSPRGQSKVTARAALGSILSLLGICLRYRRGRYRPVASDRPDRRVAPSDQTP